MRALISQHPGDEAHHSLSNHQRCHFPTDQHIIADGNLAHAVAPSGVIHHALIDALITPAGKNNVLLIGPRPRICLAKRFSRWRRHDKQWEVAILIGRGINRIGLCFYPF